MLGIIGGGLASAKMARLESIVTKVDALALMGGVANSFLFASGTRVGKSTCEPELAGWVSDFLAAAQSRGCEIILPVDFVIATRFEAGAAHQVASAAACPENAIIMDCGPATVDVLAAMMRCVRAVCWHGPVGVLHLPPFNAGTAALARRLARFTKEGRIESFASGQDTVDLIGSIGISGDFTAVSATGWAAASISPARIACANA